MKHISLIFAAALMLGSAFSAPAFAQDEANPRSSSEAVAPKKTHPSPNAIVDAAEPSEWVAIAAEDLLVMTLAPPTQGPGQASEDGKEREVIIQLMPAPFSQGWVSNMRTLARAKWYDGITVNRVQDNYVVQWGDPHGEDPEKAKPLPEGLKVMDEGEYEISNDTLSQADSLLDLNRATNSDVSNRTPPEMTSEQRDLSEKVERAFSDPTSTEEEHDAVIEELLVSVGLAGIADETTENTPALISIETTRRPYAMEGWHQRDSYATWVEFWQGWPIANEEHGFWFDQNDKVVLNLPLGANRQDYYQEIASSQFWPIHCYGMVGVGRGYSPDTGSGAELYTVIGHAPRHLDRNIALVGRIISGMEHLSSMTRGSGPLGFYTEEEAGLRTPITSIRVASDLPETEQPSFEFLDTRSESFERYIDARANRRDPFFIVPAGGADICNIPVPVRRVENADEE